MRIRFLTIASLTCLTMAATAADHPPAHHSGEDLVLNDGDTIWGVHTGIGRFHIPDGSTVLVLHYDGLNPERGEVTIVAGEIEILGSLDASGSGFTGGGGGGGGGEGQDWCGAPTGTTYYGWEGGAGRYPRFEGERGGNSTSAASEWCPGGAYPGWGGLGAGGDGPWRGVEGVAVVSREGGYAGFASNGDVSTGKEVWKGSGGAGLRGESGHFCCSGGTGGAAGGCGGGAIRLAASQRLSLGPNSAIESNGTLGGRPSRDLLRGRDAWPPEDLPRHEGGTGAGGGILLEFPPNTIVAESTRISSRGGSGGAFNGGTVKLRALGVGVQDFPNAQITAGRLLIVHSDSDGWAIY